jgi:membrane protease YdiL (CAAX protease family)
MKQPIASARHTASVIGILAMFAAWGAYNAAGMRARGAQHHTLLYIQTFAFEWLLAAYVAWGVRRRGVPLSSIFGERWAGPGAMWRDVRAAAGFWIVSLIALGLLSHVLGITNQRASTRFLLPEGAVETAMWVALSITAGICEEAIFRGYLQRQFLALTGQAAAAIALSAIVFAAGHAYQGARGAVLIGCYGAMFGVLAHRRQSVRPGMIAHSFQDTISGILGSKLPQ